MKKLDYLESLRGLAALTVVFAHFVVGFYPALFWAKAEQVHTGNAVEIWISGTPLNLFYNGAFSVAIFFVLSGYVLSYRFFRDRSAPVLLVPLTVKRYVRLLIPILFCNITVFALLSLSLFFNQPASVVTKSSDWLGAFWLFTPDPWHTLKASFFGAFFSHDASHNTALWTMTYEFYGSLIVFGFIALFGRSPKRLWFYALAILIFRRKYYLAFVLGMLLADLSTGERNPFRKVTAGLPFVLLLLAGLLLGSVPAGRPLDGTFYGVLTAIAKPRTLHILGAFLVMLALLHLKPLQRFLSHKPFVFLGRISFSMYILHVILIGTLSSWLMLRLVPYFSYHAAFLMTAGMTFPVLMVLSHYAYKYVDSAGINMSQSVYKLIVRRLYGAPAPPAGEQQPAPREPQPGDAPTC